MTRARSLAEQANNNVWLGLAQKAVTLAMVPFLLTAFWTLGASYVTLRDDVRDVRSDLRVAKAQIATLEAAAFGMRADLTVHTGSLATLRAQREGDIQLGSRVDELRDEQRAGNARINARLDAMMTPSRRMVP
ncbi:MAG: hypothetical protein JWR10_3640 [Rubritepida sp.]|nr:hypothetical protein [Rubritepida sp.]